MKDRTMPWPATTVFKVTKAVRKATLRAEDALEWVRRQMSRIDVAAYDRWLGDWLAEDSEPMPGPCGDPECQVLHADPEEPIHPPWYVDSRAPEPFPYHDGP